MLASVGGWAVHLGTQNDLEIALRQNMWLGEILERFEEIVLPDCWLVAGAIAQTILHYSCCPGATSTSLSWWSSRCNPPWREAGCPPTAAIFAGAKRDLSPSSAFFSSWFCSRHPPCSQPASQRPSNAVTVASNFGLRCLRRDQPSPESVALKVFGSAHAGRPTR